MDILRLLCQAFSIMGGALPGGRSLSLRGERPPKGQPTLPPGIILIGESTTTFT
jgi:hypothetical protein